MVLGRTLYLRRSSIFIGEREIVCDHCSALEKVLTDLVGLKVTHVIMRRVTVEVHGPSPTTFPKLQTSIVTADAIPISPIVPKRYTLQA